MTNRKLALGWLRHVALHPRETRPVLRLIAEEGFNGQSPLPFVPENVLRDIGRSPVTLPPANMFEWGTQGPAGLIFIASLACTREARTIFEFGTFTGVTSLCLAESVPGAEVHTLDLPSDEATLLGLDERDRSFRRGPPILGHPRVTQHFGDSASFDFSPWYERCDLIFIDGAHSFEYVRSDTQNAEKMLATGGVIVWDDYSRKWPGVVRYLDSRTDLALYRVPQTHLVVSL